MLQKSISAVIFIAAKLLTKWNNIAVSLVFYSSKNLNCNGALSFFLRSAHIFS